MPANDNPITLGDLKQIIEGMDAAEADAMGVSCQYFAHKLVEELEERYGAA